MAVLKEANLVVRMVARRVSVKAVLWDEMWVALMAGMRVLKWVVKRAMMSAES